MESVRALLQTYGHRVSASEQDRLLKLAPDLQSRGTAALNTDAANPGEVRQQALSQAPVDAHAPMLPDPYARQQCVRVVHQVYGLFGDDKPMSVLFQTSHKQLKDVATAMSAYYHLWDAGEVES